MNELVSKEKSLDKLFINIINKTPNSIALGLADKSIAFTFKKLQENIDAFTNSLRLAGIKPGDMVTLVMPNSIEFVIAFLGIISARATAAPLNFDFKQNEFEFYLEDQKPVAIIDLPKDKANQAARGAAAKQNIPVFETDWEMDYIILSRTTKPIGKPAAKSQIEPQNDVALFLHTSGTTSRPKGVPLTHENITASIKNIINTYEFNGTDSSLIVMPLFHVHGLMTGLLSPLAAGASVYIPATGKFSASTFWHDILNVKATWYTAVPTIHQILLSRYEDDYPKTNPPNLRFIRSCSSPLAATILADMEKRFNSPVLEAYAMTEASHQMSSNPLPKNGIHKPNSVGKGQNVEIVILNEKFEKLPTMQKGEICIKGENVTKGYINNPEANRVSFGGGYFHTGDQGYLDNDGYLFITGRLKELINRGGEKISPIKIDDVLLSNPFVAEAVCFGVPDTKYGEEVNAAIVLKPKTKLTAEELTNFCLEHLSKFEIPKKIFFVDSLPKTGSGKIQRSKIAEYFISLNK